jgi:PAS domain S-box-containing protein
MERASPRSPVALLGGAGLVLVAAHVFMPEDIAARAVVSAASGTLAAGIAAGVVLASARRPDAWASTRRFGLALLALALVQGAFLVVALVHPPDGPYGPSGLIDLAVLGIGALLVPLFRSELREHFPREDRRDVLADVVLLAAAGGTLVYLVMRPDSPPTPGVTLSVVVWTAVVMTGMIAWTALAAWLPSPVHIGLCLALASFGMAGLGFGFQWFRGSFVPGGALIDLPVGIGALFLAALLWAEPRLVPNQPAQPTTRWGRALLTAVAVGAACASLAFVALTGLHHQATQLETSVGIGLLGGAIAARIVLNQITSTRAAEEVARALAEKDGALTDADAALARLREVHRSLSASEERLRLLLDAAADGIVELDERRIIRRANEAFCEMLGVAQAQVVGTSWDQLGAVIDGGATLVELPETGRATVPRRGQDLHLEARTSALPGAGELLVIRDVTAARVADQTIRSLLQFLQDRDEDRTRLLQRTNAAIESERNRMARDLHDGPVQGVSAASLSLEAVLMMLRNGHAEKAAATLEKIREELAEEGESLRRLMSDMRPPVLDERGLVPALREVLARFGRETGVKTSFGARSLVDVPPDMETLAYRVVQEALTNAAKHADATELSVHVEAVAGQLRIEIADDGVGFDANRARDFLRAGRVGLASMRERTELANGSFMVRSAPGQGTAIVATLPIDVAAPRSQRALA